MAFSADPGRRGLSVPTRVPPRGRHYIPPPPMTLQSQLSRLNAIARVCRGWFEALDWHLVYAQLPQDRITVRDLRDVPHDRCSRALMHGIVCAGLATQPPRARRLIDVAPPVAWSPALEWQSDFGFVWGYDALTRQDIRETECFWCNSNGLPRDRNTRIYFVSDLRAAVTDEERFMLNTGDYAARMQIVIKHGFKHRFQIRRVWISGMGWQWPNTIPYASVIRAALAAWQDSEHALADVQMQARRVRNKRLREAEGPVPEKKRGKH